MGIGGGAKNLLAEQPLADVAVFDADPTAVDHDTIRDIRVLETFKEDRRIFAATDGRRQRGGSG